MGENIENREEFLACLDQQANAMVFAYAKHHLLVALEEVGFTDYRGLDYVVMGKVAEALRGRDTAAALWGLVFIDLWYCSNFGGPHWAQLMARDPNAVGLAIQAACWVHAVSGADGGPALAALLNRHRCWEIAEQCVRCSTMRWVRDWWRRSVLPQRTQ